MYKSTTSLCALIAIAASALTAAGPASALQYKDASAGTACQASNGGAAVHFLFNNNSLTNNGTTDQYVVCQFAQADPSSTPLQPQYLVVHAAAGATGGTIVCSAQVGGYYFGVNTVSKSQARSAVLTANSNTYLTFDTTGLARGLIYDVFTMNCKLPAGFKLGLIEYQTD